MTYPQGRPKKRRALTVMRDSIPGVHMNVLSPSRSCRVDFIRYTQTHTNKPSYHHTGAHEERRGTERQGEEGEEGGWREVTIQEMQ